MAENKTKATDASVDDHIAAVVNEDQRRDCLALVKLLRKVTNAPPRMWGPTIVGFGSYHYRYESGREGDACLTGFAVRGKDIVVYVMAGGAGEDALREKLGRHQRGKACLYIRSLKDVDVKVLEQLVANSIAYLRQLYGRAK